jgi:glycosyltransferase involved in cell wall biosynthesis
MWAVADVAISTSENEGMPVALIEAQLAGIPVVAVDVGSVGEVVVDDLTGYLFSEFGESYIEKLRELISNPAKIKRLGSEAERLAKKEFSPENMVNSHLALFDEILVR